MRDIFESYSVSELKKEVSKYNHKVKISGYSKLKKSELIDKMLKHKEVFKHMVKRIPKPKKVTLAKKEAPKPKKAVLAKKPFGDIQKTYLTKPLISYLTEKLKDKKYLTDMLRDKDDLTRAEQLKLQRLVNNIYEDELLTMDKKIKLVRSIFKDFTEEAKKLNLNVRNINLENRFIRHLIRDKSYYHLRGLYKPRNEVASLTETKKDVSRSNEEQYKKLLKNDLNDKIMDENDANIRKEYKKKLTAAQQSILNKITEILSNSLYGKLKKKQLIKPLIEQLIKQKVKLPKYFAYVINEPEVLPAISKKVFTINVPSMKNYKYYVLRRNIRTNNFF